MTVYIVQGRYSDQALKGMVAKPEDRGAEVAKLAEVAGFKMRDYFITFGEHDFLIVFEGGDDVEALAMLLTAGASGGITDLKTTVAVSTTDARKAMEKAGALAKRFRAPGA